MKVTTVTSDKPVCSHSEAVRKFQVGLNSQVEILCEVESNPPSDLTFHWVFNTSGETMQMEHGAVKMDGSRSIVDYTPRYSIINKNCFYFSISKTGLC